MQILHLKIWPAWQVLTDDEKQEKMGILQECEGYFY